MTGLLRGLCLALALAFAAGLGGAPAIAPAAAQQAQEALDYDAWERTATRAEDSIEAGRASAAAFESLREELVRWRDRFLEAQSQNASTIATVERQLEALGPVPEEGTESDDVAADREALNERLSELQAPARRAELAYSRADGLIRAVDSIIRERQAEALLALGPVPVNPVHWLPAATAVTKTLETIRHEVVNSWQNPIQQAETRQNLPAVLLLSIAGFVLFFRGRRWSRRLTAWVLGDHPGAGRWLAGFALSMGSLLLPLLGVYAITEAIDASGLMGLVGGKLVAALLPSAFVFLAARWLATRIFPAKEARTLPLNLDDAHRYFGRWLGATLGLVAAGYFLLKNTAEFARWSEATTNALLFPLLAGSAYVLFRLAGLLRLHTRNAVAQEGEETYRTRLTRSLVLALRVVSVAAPLLAAAGYFNLAHFLLFPTLASLGLLAILLILQRLVVEIYVLVTGNREGAAESLIPVLMGFVLVLAALPFFALAWGARVADLSEIWTRTMAGFEIGGTRISPAIFLTFAVVFVLGYLATRIFQGALKNTVLPKTRIDPGGQNAIVSGIGYVGIFLAAIIAITAAGLDLSSIAIVAGALSVGIGFGLQTIVSNFVSGIILLIERPISEGDWIEVGGVHGYVRNISVRATVIETFDRSDVIVPNSDLVSGRVTNYTRGNTVGRVIVPVGVAYGTDTRKVERILKEVAEAHPMVLMSSPPYIVFKGFGADSLDFEIRAILRDVNWVLSVHSDMNHEIARRFAEEGVEIPFAQRDVWLRNPEVLRGDWAGKAKAASTGGDPGHARAHLTDADIAEARDGAEDVDADADGDGDADADSR